MQVPGPLRAFVGLLATTTDEAKHLPDRAIELPMLVVSTALQMSLRAQQRYARLAARGDEVINRRPTTDEPPPWATFDDPVPTDELRAIGLDDPDPVRRARAASDLLDELLSGGSANVSRARPDRAAAKPVATTGTKTTAAKDTRSTADKQPAKKATSRAGAAARKTPAKKQPAKKATARKAGGTPKAINAPRHTAPSAFDNVEDD